MCLSRSHERNCFRFVVIGLVDKSNSERRNIVVQNRNRAEKRSRRTFFMATDETTRRERTRCKQMYAIVLPAPQREASRFPRRRCAVATVVNRARAWDDPPSSTPVVRSAATPTRDGNRLAMGRVLFRDTDLRVCPWPPAAGRRPKDDSD